MDNDTDLGGPEAVFPVTRCSLVQAAASRDPNVRHQAFEDLIAAYWKPVYKYIRVKWSLGNEDAKDLTQAFFARTLEKDFLDRFDPDKARFRTFLRVCVDGFVANEQRAAVRLKRGGDVNLFPLDFESADAELRGLAPVDPTDLDEFLRKEWLRNLFSLAVEDLRLQFTTSGKDTHFALFQRYDLEGPDLAASLSYAQLGQEFGLSTSQITNFLALTRREFRRIVLERLRAMTGSEDEFQQESRRLFGGQAP